MTAHAALGSAPVLRIGDTPLPVLGRARVYVCGITPYETTHVGHAATFVWADVAARVLRLVGATVEVCRNVTDIDDHLLIQAKRDGVHWRSLAVQETYRFERDMAQLGVVRPTYEPRSRDYVDEVIVLAGRPAGQRRGVRAQRLGVLPRHRCRVECGILIELSAIELARERGGTRATRQGRSTGCRAVATIRR